MQRTIEVRPIGHVAQLTTTRRSDIDDHDDDVVRIVLDPDQFDAGELDRLSSFDAVSIIYASTAPGGMIVESSTCAVTRIDGRRLHVRGCSAEPGDPVLDIQPLTP